MTLLADPPTTQTSNDRTPPPLDPADLSVAFRLDHVGPSHSAVSVFIGRSGSRVRAGGIVVRSEEWAPLAALANAADGFEAYEEVTRPGS